MPVETPQTSSTVSGTFQVGGWALDLGAPTGTGVDAVHVYAYPNPGSGTPPIFLGVAALGGSRPDVGAVYGSQFNNSGYNLLAQGLSPGVYQIVVYARSTITGTFNNSRAVVVTVQ